MGTDDIADLTKFLKRPLKIAEFQWPVGAPVNQEFSPFELLLDQTAIARKTANFRNLHGKLHIKVVMNGNPFYFGRLLASWEPFSDQASHHEAVLVSHILMQRSQRMHILMNPTESEPGYFTVPFFFPRQSFNLLQGTDASTFGKLEFRTLNELAHANNSTDSINVSVFAWLEQMDLGAPTSSPSLIHPSGIDEREGKVYKIATKTGAAAKLFTSVPVIAPFASALEKSSTATAKIAKLFGWSKPEKDYGDNMIPYTTDDMATTDGCDAIRRLVGDSKQGLTIDPRTTGLPAHDELAISELVKKESYFTTTVWSSESSGDRLASVLIDPGVNAYNAGTEAHQYLPMGVPALCHKYWTGSIDVRVQVVCSKFHRGRLLIQYDPEYYVGSDPATNTAYTHIMDISQCTDATFSIGWGQNAPFREVAPPVVSDMPMSNLPYGNGYLSIYVLNELVSVEPAPSIEVNVFMAGGDDLRFASPSGQYVPRIAFFPPDENYVSPSGLTDHDKIQFQPTTVPVNIFHEHFGETTISMRTLMKRYNFYSSQPIVAPTAGTEDDLVQVNLNMINYPTPLSINSAVQVPFDDLSVAVQPGIFSSNNVTTVITLVGSCFAATRGGLRWCFVNKLMARGGSNNYYGVHQAHGFASRSRTPVVALDVTSSPLSQTTLDTRSAQALSWAEDFQNGSMVTDLSTNSLLKVEVPFYSNLRFSQVNLAVTRPLAQEIADSENLNGVRVVNRHVDDIASSHVTQTIVSYVACAEDFSFMWFQCVPSIYFTTNS